MPQHGFDDEHGDPLLEFPSEVDLAAARVGAAPPPATIDRQGRTTFVVADIRTRDEPGPAAPARLTYHDRPQHVAPGVHGAAPPPGRRWRSPEMLALRTAIAAHFDQTRSGISLLAARIGARRARAFAVVAGLLASTATVALFRDDASLLPSSRLEHISAAAVPSVRSGGTVRTLPPPARPVAREPDRVASAAPRRSGSSSAPGTSAGAARSTPAPPPSPNIAPAATRRAASAPTRSATAAATRPIAPAATRPVAGTAGSFRGSLAVRSSPGGARVFINGVEVGTTPITLPNLGVGSRAMRIELPGYANWSGTVRIVANERTVATVQLREVGAR